MRALQLQTSIRRKSRRHNREIILRAPISGCFGTKDLPIAIDRLWPNCAGRAGGAAAPHSGHLNRDASAMGFRLRPAPIGQKRTFYNLRRSRLSAAGVAPKRISDIHGAHFGARIFPVVACRRTVHPAAIPKARDRGRNRLPQNQSRKSNRCRGAGAALERNNAAAL
jgi:hypothetical protein